MLDKEATTPVITGDDLRSCRYHHDTTISLQFVLRGICRGTRNIKKPLPDTAEALRDPADPRERDGACLVRRWAGLVAEPAEILRRSMKRHPEPQWFIGIRPAGWTVNRRTPALIKTTATAGGSSTGDAYTRRLKECHVSDTPRGFARKSASGVHPTGRSVPSSRTEHSRCSYVDLFYYEAPGQCRERMTMGQARTSHSPAPLGDPELCRGGGRT